MNKILTTLISIAILVSPITAMGQINHSSASNKSLAVSLAPIKKDSDIKAFLMMTPLKKSPLRYLSRTDQKIFLNSLTFNEKGITGFNSGVLQRANLSKNQVLEITSLIGYQHLIKTGPISANRSPYADWRWSDDDEADRNGYKCESTGSCKKAWDYICTDNC